MVKRAVKPTGKAAGKPSPAENAAAAEERAKAEAADQRAGKTKGEVPPTRGKRSGPA